MAKMSCQMLVFSGQPNPRWQLTKEQTAIFEKVFDASNQKGNWQEPSVLLGYRGCMIEIDGNDWFVFKGNISQQSDSRVSRQDPSRSIEKFILQSAPSKWNALVSGIMDTEFK